MWEIFYVLCAPHFLAYRADSCEQVREYMPNPAFTYEAKTHEAALLQSRGIPRLVRQDES